MDRTFLKNRIEKIFNKFFENFLNVEYSSLEIQEATWIIKYLPIIPGKFTEVSVILLDFARYDVLFVVQKIETGTNPERFRRDVVGDLQITSLGNFKNDKNLIDFFSQQKSLLSEL